MATIPGQLTFADQQQKLLHLLREPGPDDGTSNVIPVTGDFPQITLQRDLNIALGVFIGETGLSPALTEKTLTNAIVAGLDLALPADLASLTRLEYKPAGQPAYVLEMLSFEEYDARTGGSTLTDTGQPYFYREPFAGYVRLSPQPGAGNVSAGDTITWYYSSLGTILVNPTDVPGIPAQFHIAPVYACLVQYWMRKQDPVQSQRYEQLYDRLVERAKAYVFDKERSGQPTVAGANDGWDAADLGRY